MGYYEGDLCLTNNGNNGGMFGNNGDWIWAFLLVETVTSAYFSKSCTTVPVSLFAQQVQKALFFSPII